MSRFNLRKDEEEYIKRTRWKNELERLRRKIQKAVNDSSEAKLPRDPVKFCVEVLGFQPTSYQARLLREVAKGKKRILLRWARQSGKTWILAALIIWFCSLHPNHLALIIAPGLRQSMILSDKIHELLNRVPRKIRRRLIRQQLRTVVRFKNGSQIVALPNSEHLLRGYTAHLIVVDEAAFFHNDETIFMNVLQPMMATTDGTMIVSSTPWGKKTIFYQLNQDPDWSKHWVTWKEAVREGRYSPEFVKELMKIREQSPQVFKMEYEADFIEDVDTWLSQDLLAKICSEDLEYIPFEAAPQGRFYAGVDLAERVDYTVIAVVEKQGDHLNLVHMKRFPLGTSLASAIGYLKVLSDRWNRIHAVYVDNTKHGDYIIQDMVEAGVPNPKGIAFTQATKMEMAQLMKQRMREGLFHMPFDRETLDELNVEKYELTKTGKISFSHPEGTHDDRFWALALAIYAAETEPPPPNKPLIRTI